MTVTSSLYMRVATLDDIPAIEALMAESMARLLPHFLDSKQVERSSESMGVDTLLVSDGTYFLELTAASGNDTLELAASSDFDGAVSRVVLYRETAACAPAGTWDYVLVPQNVDNVAGDPTPAFSTTIY